MAIAIKPGWSRPSTILFAAEIPVNEKAFTFALAQAAEFGARFILFHAYDTLVVSASETSGVRYYDDAAAARIEHEALEPVAERVRAAGLRCDVIVRPGLPSDQILKIVREHEIDRVIMGTRSPGRIGKILVGSVAEAVLRSSTVPVCVVGPQAVTGEYRQFPTNVVLCAVSLEESSRSLVQFAAQLALEHRARLVLEHVTRVQDRHDEVDGRSHDQLEGDLLSLVPSELQSRLVVEPIVVEGEPVDELIFQARAQMADLIVIGARGNSPFTFARQGIVYKLMAQAHCPVITLSPAVIAAEAETLHETYGAKHLAGTF